MWTTPMENALIETLLVAKQEGLEGSDVGNFRGPAWERAIKAVQSVTSQPINREICDNRWRRFKRNWALWAKHRSQVLGWAWDENLETYVTDEAAADAYYRENPEMLCFRFHGPTFRPQLEILLDDKDSAGRYAKGINRLMTPTDEDNLSPSPAPAFNEQTDSNAKRAATIDAKALAESIQRLVDSMSQSNAVVADILMRPAEKAVRTFMNEHEEILPDDWRDENGQIPYNRIHPVLDLFNDSWNCNVYLALPKRYKRDWVLHNLAKPGQEISKGSS